MTKQITLKEALELVSFYQVTGGRWRVLDVYGDIDGDVKGCISGDIYGDINVTVGGTINGREWKFVEETPRDKLQRLIKESGNQELIDTFNQMENNS